MKKSFVLLILLLLLGTGAVCYAQSSILPEKDNVQFTETVLYGDKSLVEGVTVTMKNEWNRMLFWESTYVIGETPSVTTNYEFYPWEVAKGTYYYEGGIELNVKNIIDDNWEELGDKAQGLNVAMQELCADTQPGEEKHKAVLLKDYAEYYPFVVNIYSPQMLNYENGTSVFQYEWERYEWNEAELLLKIAYNEQQGAKEEVIAEDRKALEKLQIFKEFFKIPVLENDLVRIAVGKDEEGNVIGWAAQNSSYGTSTNNVDIPYYEEDYEKYDGFNFYIESVMRNGDCYFTFEPYTYQHNQPVDTSHIPGGYGIYYFDYDEKTGEIYPEHLKMVYALDPAEHFYDIAIDVKGKNLLVTTKADEGIYLNIIDISTMTQRDRVLVSTEEYLYGHWLYEDYMVLYGENLMVWEIDENGNYTLQFSAPMENAEELTDSLVYAPTDEMKIPTKPIEFMRDDWVTDWNGEQLVICNYMVNEEGNQESSFYVAVIDETGLCYLASYKSSLITGEAYGGCEPSREEPLAVYWK